MIYQDLETGGHKWEKKNLVTISGKKGGYDILECSCGLKGKTFQLGRIQVNTKNKMKAQKCPVAKPIKFKVRTIRITNLGATGRAFSNLTPQSEHRLIEPPADRDSSEYWVEGVGEPVRVLRSEFIFIDNG